MATTADARNPSDKDLPTNSKSTWVTSVIVSIRDSVANTINTFLESHFSAQRSLVHVRWFVSVLLAVLASCIIICAGIASTIPDGPALSTASNLGVSSLGLAAHLTSLLFIPSLWLELLFTLTMSGASGYSLHGPEHEATCPSIGYLHRRLLPVSPSGRSWSFTLLYGTWT
ncbi:hypothetical protein BOTBODRAFT_406096 [Botryobasidium botryosum FD-172 SS1]|uniref:Uncharacterized protein n=1 Tax=Botryobasidium botryosum (strain FD-172 SS1) TaxID=930990 RepID=A0A067MMZ6_BOTB1|nr:hypothetical protein BOTBODRAFT_406096 [Botryobasidium botryosum FD-172 SS1]